MRKIWLFVLIGLLAIGCRSDVVEEENDTPTPTAWAQNSNPIVVALSKLATNPSDYAGNYIRLTGRYKRLPRLICESAAQPSPATWGLTSDTLLALASGFDAQLRPLLPEGLTMTVAGRWQYWEGPVGCGDAAQPQKIWYLAVTHILSPSPITQVTLTPDSAPAETQDGLPDDAETAVSLSTTDESPGDTETAVSPTPSANQPTGQPTSASSIPTATPTSPVNATTLPGAPTATPTVTHTPIPGAPPPATATPTISATPTASATPLPGTTPTPVPTQPSNATATSTPVLNNIVKEQLDPESLYTAFLGPDERHQWTFYNEVNDNKLTANFVSVNNVDIAIAVTSPSGDRLISQNNTGIGQVETITNLNLPQEGEYLIEISAANGGSGDYGLLVLEDVSFPITFDIISYNNLVATTFNENSEQLWFFTGSQGDDISITAVPNSTADIGFDLMGPNGETLESIDALDDGETEQLTNYTLSQNGLYAVWLFGFDNGTIKTDLTVTKN